MNDFNRLVSVHLELMISDTTSLSFLVSALSILITLSRLSTFYASDVFRA